MLDRVGFELRLHRFAVSSAPCGQQRFRLVIEAQCFIGIAPGLVSPHVQGAQGFALLDAQFVFPCVFINRLAPAERRYLPVRVMNLRSGLAGLIVVNHPSAGHGLHRHAALLGRGFRIGRFGRFFRLLLGGLLGCRHFGCLPCPAPRLA